MDLSSVSPKSSCCMDENRESIAVSNIAQFSSSFSMPKISGTTVSIAAAIDSELGVNLQSNHINNASTPIIKNLQGKNCLASNQPVIVKPLYSDEPVQFSFKEKENEEKTAYEIAAEALCLMKHSGGKVPARAYPQSSSVEFCNSFDISGGSVKLSVDSEVIVDSGNELSSAHENGVEVSIMDAHSSSCNNENSSKKVIKYVLVPETAIVSAEHPSDVSKTGMPLLYMVPQGDGVQQKVYKLTRPQPRVIKIKKKTTPASGESILSLSNNENVLLRSDLQQDNFSMESSLDGRNKDDSVNDVSIGTKTKSIRGKRQMPKKHDTLKFPPCVICSGEASGLHYGCNTCEACKNFFRRCLLRKSSTPFICHSGNNCEISFKKNKNNCSACRLHKCTEAGMAKEKCKMGRYTALMRTETIKKVRKLEGKDADQCQTELLCGGNSPIPGTSNDEDSSDKSNSEHSSEPFHARMISAELFSERENADLQSTTESHDDLIKNLVNAMHTIKPWGDDLCSPEARSNVFKQHHEKYQTKVKVFGSMKNVSMSEYQFLLRQFGIDIDGQWQSFKEVSALWDPVMERYCAFMQSIPNFTTLSYDDQANMLKATHCDFFTLLTHQGFDKELGVYLEASGVPFHVNEVGDRIITRDLILNAGDLCHEIQNMGLLDFEMALLLSIISMSTDRCQLKNPSLVETTQQLLIEILMKHLNKTYGTIKGRQRFTSFIDMLIKLRGFSHIYMKEYRTLCQDEMIKQGVPDIDIILPEED